MKTSVTLALQADSFVAPFRAIEIDQGLQWAVDSGADGVELSIAEPTKIDEESINETLKKLGLEVSTIATGVMVGKGLTFCDMDESVRKAAVRHIKDHIELATKLSGRPNVTIGLARGVGGGTTEQFVQQRLWIEECLSECGAYAQGHGIVLNLEPFVRYESEHLHKTEECVELIEKINCKGAIGVLYDTFHSNVEDADMAGVISDYVKYISHIHFADSNRQLPGEGHIDFDSIMSTINEVGYDKYISLEVTNTPSSYHIIECIDKFISLAKG